MVFNLKLYQNNIEINKNCKKKKRTGCSLFFFTDDASFCCSEQQKEASSNICNHVELRKWVIQHGFYLLIMKIRKISNHINFSKNTQHNSNWHIHIHFNIFGSGIPRSTAFSNSSRLEYERVLNLNSPPKFLRTGFCWFLHFKKKYFKLIFTIIWPRRIDRARS